MYTAAEQQINSLVQKYIAELISALQPQSLDLEHLRYVATDLRDILDLTKQKHLPVSKRCADALRDIIELRATTGDSKKLIEALQTQQLVLDAEFHLDYPVKDLSLALRAASDRFNLSYVAEGQDQNAPLLPRLLEILAATDSPIFADRIHLRADNMFEGLLGIDIIFYGLSDDEHIKRIADAYFKKFGVQAINLRADGESHKRQMLTLSVKTIIQDLLPSITQQQVDILVAKGYCHIKHDTPKPPKERSRFRLGLGCC